MFTLDKRIALDKIFPHINNKAQLLKLKIDYDFVTHVTCPNDAKKICFAINKHIETYKTAKECTIIDATGGAGGDTISFSNFFGSVISIELDTTKYEYLKNNTEIYECKNVHIINGNSVEVIPKIPNVDIIYVDPPWGGKDYKNTELIRLTFGGIEIEELAKLWLSPNYLLNTPKCVAFKLPKNYDIKYFFDTLNSNTQQFNVFLYEIRKLFILIVENKEKPTDDIKSDQ